MKSQENRPGFLGKNPIGYSPRKLRRRSRFVGPGSGANVVGHATSGVFGTVDDHHLQKMGKQGANHLGDFLGNGGFMVIKMIKTSKVGISWDLTCKKM